MGSSEIDAQAPATVAPPVLSRRAKVALAISGLAAVAAEATAWATEVETSAPVLALAAVSLLSAGLPTLKKDVIALNNLTLNIHFLSH